MAPPIIVPQHTGKYVQPLEAREASLLATQDAAARIAVELMRQTSKEYADGPPYSERTRLAIVEESCTMAYEQQRTLRAWFFPSNG